MGTVGTVVFALAIACTCLNLLVMIWCALRSTPAALQRAVVAMRTEHLQWQGQVEKFDADRRTYTAALEGLIEEAQNQFDRVERKRRSAAATAQRAGAAQVEDPEPEPGSPAWRDWARGYYLHGGGVA